MVIVGHVETRPLRETERERERIRTTLLFDQRETVLGKENQNCLQSYLRGSSYLSYSHKNVDTFTCNIDWSISHIHVKTEISNSPEKVLSNNSFKQFAFRCNLTIEEWERADNVSCVNWNRYYDKCAVIHKNPFQVSYERYEGRVESCTSSRMSAPVDVTVA